MRVVDADACAPRPWADGGGTTRELASGPAPSDAASPAFDWRLSLADIDRDGPFSVLAGVDRVFAPVEGRVVLEFGSAHGPCAVGADDAPLAFDGALAPRARLVGGRSARALNLMCARGRRAGALRRVALADGEAPDGRWASEAVVGGAALRGWFVQAGRVRAAGAEHGVGTLLLADADADADAHADAHAGAGGGGNRDADEGGPPRALGAARVVEFAVSARLAPCACGASTDAGSPPAERPHR